jgi:hypothetical protein
VAALQLFSQAADGRVDAGPERSDLVEAIAPPVLR